MNGSDIPSPNVPAVHTIFYGQTENVQVFPLLLAMNFMLAELCKNIVSDLNELHDDNTTSYGMVVCISHHDVVTEKLQ